MKRKVLTLGTGANVIPEEIYGFMEEVLTLPAARELRMARDTVTNWVRRRLEAIGRDNHDSVALIHNPWNQDGFGLESIALQVVRHGYPDPQAVRLEGEAQDPTIGVIAPDIIEGDSFWTLTGFPVDEGRSEVITALSPNLGMDNAGQRSLMEMIDEVPSVLPVGESLRIDGPNSVRTLVQRPKANFVPPGATANLAAVRLATNHGVYSCRFLERK